MVRTAPPPLPPGDAEHPRAAMLDTMPGDEVVKLLMDEEAAAVRAVRACAAEIARAAQLLAERLAANNRLIYVGAGTAGRIAALEAAECVPLFGLPPSLIVPVLAGGPHAMARTDRDCAGKPARSRTAHAPRGGRSRRSVCAVADDELSAFLQGAMEYARFRRAFVVLLTSAPQATVASAAEVTIRLSPGPEVIAGATRLKSATAIKLALSALSPLPSSS